MPLMSMQVDHALWQARGAALEAALPAVREMLCAQLSVPVEACHFTLWPVHGLSDQPGATIDLRVLEKPDRTVEQIRGAIERLREMMSGAAQTPVSVRVTVMDPARYFA